MVVISIRINDKNVWTAFKTFVINRFGKLKGALGQEVEAALKNYMETSQPTHSTNSTKNHNSVNKKLQKIISELPSASSISSKAIDKVIYTHAGTDPRTVRKYRKVLQDLGVLKIKQILPGGGAFIYECNPNLNIP